MKPTAGSLTIELAGQQLVLLPARAALWVEGETLLVADTHFGKAAAFRHAGLPVPEAIDADLQRLDAALDTTDARRLVVLGDFFHARAGRQPAVMQALEAWRQRRADLEVKIAAGNHDLHAGAPPAAWGFAVQGDPIVHGPFAFRHHPDRGGIADGLHLLAGHVHPAAAVRTMRGRMTHRLPCFHVGVDVTVLPAFGTFTGTALVRPGPRDRLMVIADGAVHRLTG